MVPPSLSHHPASQTWEKLLLWDSCPWGVSGNRSPEQNIPKLLFLIHFSALYPTFPGSSFSSSPFLAHCHYPRTMLSMALHHLVARRGFLTLPVQSVCHLILHGESLPVLSAASALQKKMGIFSNCVRQGAALPRERGWFENGPTSLASLCVPGGWGGQTRMPTWVPCGDCFFSPLPPPTSLAIGRNLL